MPQTLVTINNPIEFVIQSTVDASFPLLVANFNTGVVTSAILPAKATELLTTRIQAIFTALGASKAAFEPAFPGLVEHLLGAIQLEAGSMAVAAGYAAPNATLTLSSVANPASIAIVIPFSTSAGIVGAP